MNILNNMKNIKKNRGMTYVELIVILSIFSSLSTVVIFNYAEFQDRVDIKNLSNDIALKVVEAQKYSTSGRIPPSPQGDVLISNPTLKLSYGVYFNNPIVDNKNFSFFTDLDASSDFDGSSCPGIGECLEKVSITKGNQISGLNIFYRENTTPDNLEDLTITFVRPSGTAIFSSTTILGDDIDHVEISVISPKNLVATIKVYASGRVDIR